MAEVNHATKQGRILVVPIGGETYRTLPNWMTSFVTCTERFTVSDVARQIHFIQSQSIGEITGDPQVIAGREDMLRLAHMKSLKNVQSKGSPVQHVVFSGLSGMGRMTFANQYMTKSMSSMRMGGPVFKLPDMAKALDFYLAMKQDQAGSFSKKDAEDQVVAFSAMEQAEQARMVPAALMNLPDASSPSA